MNCREIYRVSVSTRNISLVNWPRILRRMTLVGTFAIAMNVGSGIGMFSQGVSLADAIEPSANSAKDARAVAEKKTSAPVEGVGAPVAPARFVLPDGFAIEMVAGPPLVRYPLFGCFDDVGRLYVAEGTGKNVPGSELVKLNLGRIVRLEDTDGDGKFDQSTVFAEGLVFPQGVLWHDGVVYVASHPAIWRLEDTDGDGRADRREEMTARFNFNGNGCDIHGPFLGPDGRLYWTDGRHGYRIERPNSSPLEGFASRIWRCRTDGSDLERLAGGGFDNPVEVAWTENGEMLGTMDQGAGDCLLHYIEGGVYPEEHPCIKEFIRTGPLLGPTKRYSVELPAALCGTMRYRSTEFGEGFRDSLITTHYMTHKLVRSTLVPDGATFRAEDTDLLVSTDPHLRLTDVLEDADGSLLTIDMGSWFTYGFLGNPLARPEMLGAIYRIRRTDVLPVTDPHGISLNIKKRSAEDLVKLLDDPRPVVRDQVIDRLAKIGSSAVRVLEQLLRSPDASVESRSNAVWALCQIDGAEARAAVRNVLTSLIGTRTAVDPASATSSVRSADRKFLVHHVAVHAAGLYRDIDSIGPLVDLLKVDDLPLRRKVAEALGRIGKSESATALFEIMRQPVDRFLEHSVIYALIQINDRDAAVRRLRDSDSRVQRAALIVLDQMKSGDLTREQVQPLLKSDDSALQFAALDVIGRHVDWENAALPVLQNWLVRPQLTDDQQKSLKELLLAGSGAVDTQNLLGEALVSSETPLAIKVLLIDVIRQSRTEPLPTTWIAGLAKLLTDGDSTLRWECLSVVRTRGWRQFDDTVRELGRDSRLQPELRVAALECLASTRQPLDAAAFDFLIGQLSESTAPLLRMAAARTLAGSTLAHDQLMQVAGRCSQVSTMILRMLLPVFTKSTDADVGVALVDALGTSPAAEALKAGDLDHLLKGYTADVRKRAEPLREKLIARQRDQAAYLNRLTAELDQQMGNADAGKEVFLAPKNNCFACHRAVGRGGTIGPDLSKIGSFRTRSELLESIIFPSLAIAPQFQTHTVATRDGRTATGLVARETVEAIYLRTPDLAEHYFARSNVEELVPSSVSMMPDGLEKNLTRQQLADLLEFLCQQR